MQKQLEAESPNTSMLRHSKKKLRTPIVKILTRGVTKAKGKWRVERRRRVSPRSVQTRSESYSQRFGIRVNSERKLHD